MPHWLVRRREGASLSLEQIGEKIAAHSLVTSCREIGETRVLAVDARDDFRPDELQR